MCWLVLAASKSDCMLCAALSSASFPAALERNLVSVGWVFLFCASFVVGSDAQG